MDNLKTSQVKERIIETLIDFGGENLVEFCPLDVQHLVNQLEIEEAQNEMLIRELSEVETSNVLLTNQNEEFKSRIIVDENELERCEVLLSESLIALKWMFDNMQVVNPDLQSDAFNIPANAIDQLEKHLEIFNPL